MVDNNLGQERFGGPKVLDPYYCRQPTLWSHDLCLEVITVHGTELRLFGAKAFPLTRNIGTTFNVFSYVAVWDEHRTHHLLNAELIRYVLRHGRELFFDFCASKDLKQRKAHRETGIYVWTVKKKGYTLSPCIPLRRQCPIKWFFHSSKNKNINKPTCSSNDHAF